MLPQQDKGPADAAEHTERQHIHLQQAERVEIVLVPFNDGAPLHRRRADRTQMVEPPTGDDEAANML